MSQSYSLKVPLLREFFPGASFILVTRDPFVMCWREATRHPDHKYRLWNEYPSLERGLRLAAQHWRNTYRIALDDLNGERDWGLVRFENFIRNTEEEVRKMASVSGVDFSRKMIPSSEDKIPLGSKAVRKWFPIDENPNNKYKKSITKKAIKVIEKEINEIDKKLGYDQYE
jgi:hypothetical protein